MEESWDELAGEFWQKLEKKTTSGRLEDFPVEKALGKIMAVRFFRLMKSHRPHRWLDNEYVFPDLKIGDDGSWFTISGRADIVLEEEDCFRILDLKTGSFKEAKKILLSLDEEGNLSEEKIVDSKDYFQMITYNRLAAADPRFGQKPVRSCLFYLANPKSELADPFLRVSGREEEKEVFARLDSLMLRHLSQLADPDIPVCQAADAGVCTYCAYNAMCRRA